MLPGASDTQKKFLSKGILNKDVDTVYQPKEKNIVPL